MKIKALLERRRGEWEEVTTQIHPDYPDTGMFMDKDRKVKVLDILCGLTWGGQFFSKSYTQMVQIVKINHSSIEKIKTDPRREDWRTQREQATLDAARDKNNQDLINYIYKLLDISATRCVCCGEIIPEGRQVCLNCERSPDDDPLIIKAVDDLRKEKK